MNETDYAQSWNVLNPRDSRNTFQFLFITTNHINGLNSKSVHYYPHKRNRMNIAKVKMLDLKIKILLDIIVTYHSPRFPWSHRYGQLLVQQGCAGSTSVLWTEIALGHTQQQLQHNTLYVGHMTIISGS